MSFDNPMDRRRFFVDAGRFASVAAGWANNLRADDRRASRILPGKVPDYVPGGLEMKWADEAMIRQAAEVHPFNLQVRMKLAANAQTTCVDPNRGYISYSFVDFQGLPRRMYHVIGDFVDDMGRHTDSLHLGQCACGPYENAQVVHKMAQNAMDVVDEGIAWDPAERPFLNWWFNDPDDKPKGARWAHLPEVTRVILGAVTYYRATGDRRGLDTARAIVHGFYRVAQKNNKYLWFPDYNYEQLGREILPMRAVNGNWRDAVTGKRIEGRINVLDPLSGTGDTSGNFPAAVMGMLLLPAIRYYEDSNDPVAAELVTKFTRLLIDLIPQFSQNMVHTHSNLATLSGVFRAGQVLGVKEFQDWAEAGYKSFISRDYIPEFGWTPELSNRPRKAGLLCCETCGTVDYLELTLRLAASRDEKYWDRAERIAMNQLLEGQMLRLDYLGRIPENAKAPKTGVGNILGVRPTDPAWFATSDHVMQRGLGCFAIGSGPNDWVQMGVGAHSLQCCFGSGPRGLYDTWYYAAQEKGDSVQINLQFSKRLPSAVITSYMPGRPALEIEMTQAKRLRVRKPAWAGKAQTSILVDGQRKHARLEGTYLEIGYLAAGTKVRVEFPDQQARKTERIGEVEFRTVWRGNAVVEMEPTGEVYPLYQGRNRRDGPTPLAFINPRPVNPL